MSPSRRHHLRAELIEGRDLHEHWVENMPVFNVTRRATRPQYPTGKSFAARNPERGVGFELVLRPARRIDSHAVRSSRCAETKVTGAPGYGRTRARGSRDDHSNRRKEIKFAATDLKLFRRQQETAIEHWDVWRLQETPKFYFLWAARLEPSRERLATLVREAQALVNTYLDGAGIFAWQERRDGSGYEALPIPASARVTDLDDVLHRIATVIRQEAPTGEPPPPEEPEERAVSQDQLPDEG